MTCLLGCVPNIRCKERVALRGVSISETCSKWFDSQCSIKTRFHARIRIQANVCKRSDLSPLLPQWRHDPGEPQLSPFVGGVIFLPRYGCEKVISNCQQESGCLRRPPPICRDSQRSSPELLHCESASVLLAHTGQRCQANAAHVWQLVPALWK